MFLEYFSLKENPFKLAIDPAYLYLSQHHEEAIAHMRYAVMEGEGFITITGMRGVGKTLVCRSFIENLGGNVEIAYIDSLIPNPEMLLKAINSKFKIRCDTDDPNELTEALNNFLMQNKLKGNRVAVFIDDAHRLKADVLEQVRLISNLETTQDKLLQIILIGEPKLSEMLDSQELRQMGQRVSVGYHLEPLSYDETIAYIRHRLSVASIGSPIGFDQKAVKHIFKYSGGIPKSINIACDRALMIAHTWNQRCVTYDMAKQAVIFITGRSGNILSGYRWQKAVGWTAALCGLSLIITSTVYFFRPVNEVTSNDQRKVEKTTTIPLPAPELSIALDSPSNRNEELLNGEDLKASVGTADTFHENSTTDLSSSSEKTYSVQVGAFRGIQYAQERVARLKAKGYSARIVTFSDPQGGVWHTVRLGDHITLELARERAEIFSLRENMETIVRPYHSF